MVIAALIAAALAGCSQAGNEQEQSYRAALHAIESKHYPQAIGVLSTLDDYKDARRLVSELRYVVNGDYIGTGDSQIAAVKSDGSIAYYGGYEDALSTNDWKHITAVSTRGEYVEGLDASGHIRSSYNGTIEELKQSTLNSVQAMLPVIDAWSELENVAAFQSSYPSSVAALLKDGTVKVLGWTRDEDEAAVRQWRDIVSVTDDGGGVMGLRSDGSVVTAGERYEQYEMSAASQWQHIVALSTFRSTSNTIGLRDDGTVVAAGSNKWGEGNVESWSDVIAVAAGAMHTVGLKRDGTVMATGLNDYGQCDVGDWTDIVAIDAGSYTTIGLKSDGTLLIVGDSSAGGGPRITQQELSEFKELLVPVVHAEG